MTYPMEHSKEHNWELDEGSPSLVDWADASDQASQGKRTKKGARCEWYKCKDCYTTATKWLDDTFPELKGKYVFNPSGGTSTYTLGNGWPCELNVKFQKIWYTIEEYLEAAKDTDNDYSFGRFKEQCVHFIMQAWVDKCDHPENMCQDRGGYGEVICSRCGGVRFTDPKDDKQIWQSDWCMHERSINGHIDQFLKALKEIGEELKETHEEKT